MRWAWRQLLSGCDWLERGEDLRAVLEDDNYVEVVGYDRELLAPRPSKDNCSRCYGTSSMRLPLPGERARIAVGRRSARSFALVAASLAVLVTSLFVG